MYLFWLLQLLHEDKWRLTHFSSCIKVHWVNKICNKQQSYQPKGYDFLNPICNTCPEVDCLVSQKNYEISDDISFCVR